MAPKERPSRSAPAFLLELGMHGAKKRFPDGRKLTKPELASLPRIAAINEGVRAATKRAADLAHSPDAAWLLTQFLNPVQLASKKRLVLPESSLMLKAIAHLEALYDAGDPTIPQSRTPDRPLGDLAAALDE